MKFQVLPTIPICFWCGQKRSEVLKIDPKSLRIPLSKIKQGEIIYSLIDYIPCTSCKTRQEQGIFVFELDYKPFMGQIPLNNKYYPTGKWLVITPQDLKNRIPDKLYQKVLKIKTLGVFVNEYRTWGFDPNFVNLH
jgi:hypothetical protein